MEYVYVVVAFYYMLSTGGQPTNISVLQDVDEYKSYVALKDCKTAKAAAIKKNKNIFYATCEKIPRPAPGIQVQDAKADPLTIQAPTGDAWGLIVSSKECGGFLWWKKDCTDHEAVYQAETELLCRREAELLERYGDRSKHSFWCDAKRFIKPVEPPK